MAHVCRLPPPDTVTKFDCFPLPRLDEALDAFAGATIFSSLDLAMAYHQVPVKPADIEKTAFITHVGLYEMTKMPFGLCNAPSTYQRLMAGVLRGLIGKICLAYLEDVIVFSKNRADHTADLSAVLERIRAAGLKLKPTKCSLFREQVLYLGHVISPAGVSPDPAKLRVLADWPAPTTVREIQSFLGFVNFYADFIDNSTELTSQLYDLTTGKKGEESVQMSAENLTAFEEIKRRLCAAPRLAHPDLERPFTLYTDASKIEVGAVLLKRGADGIERAVSFFSKKLSSAQRNYSTFERELLAVICALEHFRVYLLARKFVLRTDHRALQWLFSKEPTASARISGWLATIMEYPIVIEYVKGTENSIADALSCLDSNAVDNEIPAELARGVPSFACPAAEIDRLDARTDWLAEQRADRTISFVADLFRRSERPTPEDLENDPQLKSYVEVWPQLVLEDELLKHCNERAVSTRIVVPTTLREAVFRALHEPAHHGYEATVRRIAQRYWWPHVRAEVSSFVKACEVCDRDRNSNPAPHAPLGHLPADQPFASLYIDIVGGQGSLSLGNSPKSLLTMIDGLTGWAEAVPIADQSAATVARAVYSEWIARYGVPEQIHSDRGTQFESAVFAELCTIFGIDKTRTTPYRPQANGKCERFNRTLVSMLRRAVQKRPYDWESMLPAVLQAYRSSISEATGFTPRRLAFGSEMRLPVDFGTPLPDLPRDARTLAAEIAEDLEWSYRVAREVTGFNHKRAENRYNERVVSKMYKPGALVRVALHSRTAGVPTKLGAHYSGLCEVIAVRGPTLTLRELDTQRIFTASHDAVRASTLQPLDPNRDVPPPPLDDQSQNSAAPQDANVSNSQSIAPPQSPTRPQSKRSQPNDDVPPLHDPLGLDRPVFDLNAASRAPENDSQQTSDSNSNAANRIPALLDLAVLPPSQLNFNVDLHYPPTTRPHRNVRAPARYDSSQSFADSVHDPDFSSTRSSTPKPTASQSSAPQSNVVKPAAREKRRRSSHTETQRKKPKRVQISNAAVQCRNKSDNVPAPKRLTWAPNKIFCFAVTARAATRSDNSNVTRTQREENVSVAAHDSVNCAPQSNDFCTRADTTNVFSFELRVIEALTRETDIAHDSLTCTNTSETRIAACQPSAECSVQIAAVNKSSAHESHVAQRYKEVSMSRTPSVFLDSKPINSKLFLRRASRVVASTDPQSDPQSDPKLDPQFNSILQPHRKVTVDSRSDSNSVAKPEFLPFPRLPHDPPLFPTPNSPLMSFAPPMDYQDASPIERCLLFYSMSVVDACDALRQCNAYYFFVRGLDSEFERSIQRYGCHSTREYLFYRISRLPEQVRPLYAAAFLSSTETLSPAVAILKSGRHEPHMLFTSRVRSCFVALAFAELIREEFLQRPDAEKPEFLITRSDMVPTATPQTPQPDLASASASAPGPSAGPSSSSASGPSGAQQQSASASSSTPHVFGSRVSGDAPSFKTPKTPSSRAADAVAADASSSHATASEAGVPAPELFADPAFLVTITPTLHTAASSKPTATAEKPEAIPKPSTAAPGDDSVTQYMRSLVKDSNPPVVVLTQTSTSAPQTASAADQSILSTTAVLPALDTSQVSTSAPRTTQTATLTTATATVESSSSSTRRRHNNSPGAVRNKRAAVEGADESSAIPVEDSPQKLAPTAMERLANAAQRLEQFTYTEREGSENSTPRQLVIASDAPAAESTATAEALDEAVERAETPQLEPTDYEIEVGSDTESEPESPPSPLPQPLPSTAPRETSTSMSTRIPQPAFRTLSRQQSAREEAIPSDSIVSPSAASAAAASASAASTPRVHAQGPLWSDSFPTQEPPQSPKPVPNRIVSPTENPIAVVIRWNTYKFAGLNRTVNLVRRVTVVRELTAFYDYRVDVGALSVLEPFTNERWDNNDYLVPVKPYAQVIRTLADQLPQEYCVFHDRDAQLASLRLALPMERTVDVGRYVHLRNDALRNHGNVRVRSRDRVAPLSELWRPLLTGCAPINPVDIGIGILRMWAKVSFQMCRSGPAPSTNYAPQYAWLNRGPIHIELEESLRQELLHWQHVAHFENPPHPGVGELLPPRQGTAPFRFQLVRESGLDRRRIDALNRLMELVPHVGLAVMDRLINADVMDANYPAELRNTQQHRIEQGDKELRVFMLNITLPDQAHHERAANALLDVLRLDDEGLADSVRAMQFPEFENLDVVRRV